ncbi:MAG: maleylpyruvate isomerase family mycothiol-dependent enzyme [Nocardioides marinisabuli]|uniref:maleylpyruvate isomerase family mycothiol-dependent enzyme n=1 Tax=Nocardioides marinisabuli TaxID=419476 RepID=UPI00321928FF
MSTTDRPHTRSGPRRPRMDRETAMRLAETEYARFLALLRSLTPHDWTRPTDCPAWDVRAMAGHTTGMALMATGLPQTLRQSMLAKRRGGDPLDALTALQVDEHADLTTAQLVDRFAEVGPRAARGRRRSPAVVRRMRLPDAQDVGGRRERWTIGYLNDTILTRDPWMHRMDISRATGREPGLTADHDGVLVADVVAEWAERHARPYRLHLTGPAGGDFSAGSGGPELSLDAVDFCRLLSGRPAPCPTTHDLLDVAVPF